MSVFTEWGAELTPRMTTTVEYLIAGEVHRRTGVLTGVNQGFIHMEGLIGEKSGKHIAIPLDKVVEVQQ